MRYLIEKRKSQMVELADKCRPGPHCANLNCRFRVMGNSEEKIHFWLQDSISQLNFRGNETSKMTVTERQNDELENEIHKICVIMTRHYRLQ